MKRAALEAALFLCSRYLVNRNTARKGDVRDSEYINAIAYFEARPRNLEPTVCMGAPGTQANCRRRGNRSLMTC